jgi:hypothetical protein
VDAAGSAYITGRSFSNDGTFPATGGALHTYRGTDGNSFVAKIGAAAGPPPIEIDAFLLPTVVSVRLNAKTPSMSAVTAAGVFDVGTGVVDLTKAATVTVGGQAFNVPHLSGGGKQLSFSGNGLSLTITRPFPGSSKAKFKLRAQHDLGGIGVLDAPMTLQFTSADVDASGTVRLTRGRYRINKVRGAIITPVLSMARVLATVKGPGKDGLYIGAGIARDVPGAAPDVTIQLGETSFALIPGSAFTRTGDVFDYRSAAPGLTRVTVDFSRGTLKVWGKGLSLGTYPEGTNAVHISVHLGEDVIGIGVRMVKKKTLLAY